MISYLPEASIHECIDICSKLFSLNYSIHNCPQLLSKQGYEEGADNTINPQIRRCFSESVLPALAPGDLPGLTRPFPVLFIYLVLFENPMNSMKRQKGRTLKEELRRSVSVQYATGDQWKNNSRKNEKTAKANTTPSCGFDW